MNDRPVLLAERIDAVSGDHAARIGIVGPKANEPGIAHLGQRRIGAAKADRLAGLQDVGRHGVILRRTDRAEERDDVGLRGELGEGQHRARIGGLIVLGDKFDRLSEYAARLVDPIERDLGAGQRVFAAVCGGSGDGQHHADLDRFPLGASDARERRRRETRDEPQVYGPSGGPHAFLRDLVRSDWLRRAFA